MSIKKVEAAATANATAKKVRKISVDKLPTLDTCEREKRHVEHELGDDETAEIAKLRETIQGAAKSIKEKAEVLHNAIVEAIEVHDVSRETIIQWVEDCGYSNSRARDLVAPVWIKNYGKKTQGKPKGSLKNKNKVEALMKYARNLCADDDEASKCLRSAQRQIDAARTAAKKAEASNVVELDKAA